jgi:hypothetical protein
MEDYAIKLLYINLDEVRNEYREYVENNSIPYDKNNSDELRAKITVLKKAINKLETK